MSEDLWLNWNDAAILILSAARVASSMSEDLWICGPCSEGDHDECTSYICACCGDEAA